MGIRKNVAVVGGGIIGLAIAYTEAKAGSKVTVFEKNERAVGASIRNFGMVWPIGQPHGHMLQRALRSRQIWEEVAHSCGLWRDPVGSLHLAYRPDEVEVLEEFYASSAEKGYQCELLRPDQVKAISPATRLAGLQLGLLSKTEMIVDPREVPLTLTEYLKEKFEVKFHYTTCVQAIEGNRLHTRDAKHVFDQIYVCCGSDLEILYPSQFLATDITKVKLQMLRTGPQPNNWRMGPSLCGGLTLTHYASFSHCSSLQALKNRIQEESPWFPKWGIHVMMSQNGYGECVIGDSHEYGWVHDPFLREEVNQYILEYLWGMVQVPEPTIETRWYGVYAKLPTQTELIFQPNPAVTVVTGVGGAGMTLSFGLAEEVVG
ncbi:MAG: TIGR03364 family FAD-dependent oxidoreductase [Bacteroidota bacterium]